MTTRHPQFKSPIVHLLLWLAGAGPAFALVYGDYSGQTANGTVSFTVDRGGRVLNLSVRDKRTGGIYSGYSYTFSEGQVKWAAKGFSAYYENRNEGGGMWSSFEAQAYVTSMSDTDATIYYYISQATDALGSLSRFDTVPVRLIRTAYPGIAPPVISQSPTGAAIPLGDPCVLSGGLLNPSGASVFWVKGTILEDGGEFSGTRTTTLNIWAMGLTTEGTYAMLAMNDGGVSVSASAQVKVAFTLAETFTVSLGSTARLAAKLRSSVGLSLAWEKRRYPSYAYDPVQESDRVSGVHDSTLVIRKANTTDAGSYWLVVSSQYGVKRLFCKLVVSTTPTPPKITAQPVGRIVLPGEEVTFAVEAFGLPAPRYQWYQNGAAISGATADTFTISSAQPGHLGAYTVVVSNSQGSVTSSPPAVLAFPTPPSFTTQPASQTVPFGATARFSVTVQGTPPFAFQWLKNGQPLGEDDHYRGTDSPTLTIVRACEDDAGRYRVQVSNDGGELRSSAGVLTVTSDTVRPSVKISTPAPEAEIRVTPRKFTGTAQDNARVEQVEVRVNRGEWFLAEGAAQWWAMLDLEMGRNLIEARSYDVQGNVSPLAQVWVTHTDWQPLTLLKTGRGIMLGATNGQLLKVGQWHQLTATPAAGCVLSNWTAIDPQYGEMILTNGPTVSFQMQTDLTLVANFIPNPFLAGQGVYRGLCGEFAEFVYAVTPEQMGFWHSGALNVTLAESGQATGKLLLGGQTYPLTAYFKMDGSGRARITRAAPLSSLILIFQLTYQDTGGESGWAIRGTLSDGQWEVPLVVRRQRLFPSDRAGNYTFWVESTDNTQGPPGYGAGTLLVSPNGAVTLTGQLGDGTPISLQTGLSRDGYCPLYLPVQGGRGMLWGEAYVDNNAQFFGDLAAFKASAVSAAQKFYPRGFTNLYRFHGLKFVKPIGYRPPTSWRDGTLTLELGDLPDMLSFPVTWTNQAFKVVGPNSVRLVIAVNLTNGLFTGSFTHPLTGQSTPLNGAFLQDGDYSTGAGWFLGRSNAGSVWISP